MIQSKPPTRFSERQRFFLSILMVTEEVWLLKFIHETSTQNILGCHKIEWGTEDVGVALFLGYLSAESDMFVFPVIKSFLMLLALSVQRFSPSVSEEGSYCAPGFLLVPWCPSQPESPPDLVVQPIWVASANEIFSQGWFVTWWKVQHLSPRPEIMHAGFAPSSWDHLSLRQPHIQAFLLSRCGNNTLFGFTDAYVKGQASRISSAVNGIKFNVAECIKLRSGRAEVSVGCGIK